MGRSQAGVMLLRPCPAVAAHMLKLASSNRLLQYPFHDAEQDFFDWCASMLSQHSERHLTVLFV